MPVISSQADDLFQRDRDGHFPSNRRPKGLGLSQPHPLCLPYPLRHPKTVLVPHSGAGGELLLAHLKGAQRMVALEPNRTLMRIAMEGVPGFPTVYNEPGIETHNQDARAYLEQSEECFDLIAMPTVAGQTAMSSACVPFTKIT